MTTLDWVLAAGAMSLLVAFMGLVVYDVMAMLFGWRSLSSYWKNLNRVWVFVIGLFWGLVLGLIAGHLWWPVQP